MNKDFDELLPPGETAPLPEEYASPGTEITPPPEEFPPPGGAAAGEPPSRRKRRRKLLYAAAAGALILLLTRAYPLPPAAPETREEVPPEAAPAETAEPTAEPGPEPILESAPEPTPEQEPACEILYYCFSSAHYARLSFTAPQAFEAVELELWEPELDYQAAVYSLTPADMAAGEVDLTLPDTGELYMEHLDAYQEADVWPEVLELRATLRYQGADGPVTETRSLWPAPEQGWGLRYFPKDMEENEYIFPGCFRFTTYESLTPIALVLDDPEAAAPDVISVRFSIDGREIDPDTVRYRAWGEENEFFGPGAPTYYYARFVFPKPDWAPESGVLHVTVTEYLVNFDQTVVLERDYPFSENEEDLW